MVGPEMVYFPPNSFWMGRGGSEPDERPVHNVEFSKALLVAKTEVTRGEYEEYCRAVGESMPTVEGPENPLLPISGVTWSDAVEYCNWRSLGEGLTPCYSGKRMATACDFDADGYRLPTEAEWEFFAQATDAAAHGWYGHSDGRGPLPVDQLPSDTNELRGIAGNVHEWCWDWYSPDYYDRSPMVDPRGPERPSNAQTPYGPEKVRRSGSWNEGVDAVQPWSRSFDNLLYEGGNGFRMVRTVGIET